MAVVRATPTGWVQETTNTLTRSTPTGWVQETTVSGGGGGGGISVPVAFHQLQTQGGS